MPSVIQEIENFGGGLFLTHQGVETRLTESDLWRAFEQPVLIWVHSAVFDNSGLEQLIEIANKLPNIKRFRFTNTRVTSEGVRILHELWPHIPIEGVTAC